jgi:plastocyanin
LAALVGLGTAGLAAYAALRERSDPPTAPAVANKPPDVPPRLTAPHAPAVATSAGALRGHARFAGVAPKPAIMSMAANAHCAAHHRGEVIDESVLVSPDGILRNVVVWVSGGLEGKTFAPPAEPAVLDQHGCVFTPHVVTVMAGQRLLVKNSDPFVHNVRAGAQNNPPFNFAQPTIDKGKPLIFNAPERLFVKCDIHPWMSAFVHVIDNPYFAVSGPDGSFKLPEGLPPGKYTVSAWHEVYGEQRVEVVVAEGKPMPPLEFTFNAIERADAADAPHGARPAAVKRECCRTPSSDALAMRL